MKISSYEKLREDLEPELEDYDHPVIDTVELTWLTQASGDPSILAVPPDLLWQLYPDVLRFGPNADAVLKLGMQLIIASELAQDDKHQSQMQELFARIEKFVSDGIYEIPLFIADNQREYLKTVGKYLSKAWTADASEKEAMLNSMSPPAVPKRIGDRLVFLAEAPSRVMGTSADHGSYQSMGIESVLWVLLQQPDGVFPLLEEMCSPWREKVNAFAAHVDEVITAISQESS